MIEVHRLTVGALQENTYAVVNNNKEALIIDPGSESDKIIQWIRKNEWQPQAILLTHAHFDHIGALDGVRDAFGIEAYVHPLEQSFLTDPALNLSKWGDTGLTQRPAEHVWDSFGEKTIANFSFKVVHIPGHSPGHVIYIFEDSEFVISGDVVFRQGIGRTDLPKGSYFDLMQGIAREIMTLPVSYKLYPGHGSPTTIAQEKSDNPYFEVFRNAHKHKI